MSNQKITWRKSAARDVRPFFGAIALDSVLQAAELRLFADGAFSPELTFQVEPSSADRLAPAVRINLAQEIDFGSVKKSDLVIAITASQAFLKKTQVVAIHSLSSVFPAEIDIDAELLTQLGGGANMDVEVALCLGKRLTKKAGSPFLLGHWLAKKKFSLRAPQAAEEFDIEPVDDEGWVKLHYPAKTLYAIEYIGGMNEQASKDVRTARVRVHADIYKKLTGESSQRVSRPVLATMAADIACQILVASFSDWEAADEVTPHSPLSALLKRVDKVQPCGLEDLKKLVREAGQPRLRAILHVDLQCVRSIVEA